MAELENRVDKLEQKTTEIDNKVNILVAKMDMFIDEMRNRDNQRAAEIARLDAKMEKLREDREKDSAKHEADMKSINEKIDAKVDKLSSQIQNMAIVAVVGVGAIVWAVVSALK